MQCNLPFFRWHTGHNSITVTNTGKRRGIEATGVTLLAQQLIGFARIDLEPGASNNVSLLIPMSLLGYTGISGSFIIEPGPVEVSAGSSRTTSGPLQSSLTRERCPLSAESIARSSPSQTLVRRSDHALRTEHVLPSEGRALA